MNDEGVETRKWNKYMDERDKCETYVTGNCWLSFSKLMNALLLIKKSIVMFFCIESITFAVSSRIIFRCMCG